MSPATSLIFVFSYFKDELVSFTSRKEKKKIKKSRQKKSLYFDSLLSKKAPCL